jgi:hypothetical protein
MDSNHRSFIEESFVGPHSRQCSISDRQSRPGICPPSIAETDGARGWTGSPDDEHGTCGNADERGSDQQRHPS